MDDDDRADLDVIGIDFFELSLFILDIRVVWAQIHQRGNIAARFADGIALEHLANLIEKHDARSLAVLAHHHRAECGDGHQKALIEKLAMTDAEARLPENVVANQKVWHNIQGALSKSRNGHKLQHNEQHYGPYDTGKHFLFFFIH